MEISTNFGFFLPSRDGEDVADINKISDNFEIIDTELENIMNDAEELGDYVDDFVNSTESNQQKVNEDISTIKIDVNDLKTKAIDLENRVEDLESGSTQCDSSKPVMIVDNETNNATISIEEGLSNLINAIGQNVSFAFVGTGGFARRFDINFSTNSDFANLTFVQSVQWDTVAPAFKPNKQYRIIATCADTGDNPNLFFCSWHERTEEAGEIATTAYVDGAIGDISSALDELHTYAQSLVNGGGEV